MRAAAFAVPGDLATPTGGYTYDRRIIGELGVAGWQIQVVDLGEGFPHVDTAARGRAIERIAALPGELPVVVDGLAFGVLDAPALAHSHWLIALVHHPLALESGLSEEQAAALRASERAALASTRHVIASSPSTARLLVADYAVAADRISIVPPGTDRVPITPRMRGSTVELLAVGSVVPRKGYDILLAALTKIRDLSWRLVVAGDRTRDAATPRMLDARILRLGLEERITFAGAVTAQALHTSSMPMRICSCCLRASRATAWPMRRRSPMGCRWWVRGSAPYRRRCRRARACWYRPRMPTRWLRRCVA